MDVEVVKASSHGEWSPHRQLYSPVRGKRNLSAESDGREELVVEELKVQTPVKKKCSVHFSGGALPLQSDSSEIRLEEAGSAGMACSPERVRASPFTYYSPQPKNLTAKYTNFKRCQRVMEAQLSCDVHNLSLKAPGSRVAASAAFERVELGGVSPSRLDALKFVSPVVAAYHRRHYVNYEQVIVDGFYDVGRYNDFENLDVLNVGAEREVVVVDANNDANLQCYVRRVQSALSAERLGEKEMVLRLARLVQEFMGGSVPNLARLALAEIRGLKSRSGLNVVWVGELRYGLCRHRSLLFKYLADRVGIQSRLVRGELEGSSHAWNVVRLDGRDMILDLMSSFPEVYDASGPYAEEYHRALSRGEGGGAGGRSIGLDAVVLGEEGEGEPELAVLKVFWEIREDELQYARRNCESGSVRVRLGQGGFGVVYLARYRGTRVAVKRLKIEDPDEAMLQEFKKEVSLLMRLRHPNIVLLLGANVNPHSMMIVTEYVEKHDLKRLIERKDPTVRWEVGGRRIALDVAVALCYLHLSNILHLDVKSLNILIGRGGIAKLADVGLARTRKHASTRLEEVSTQAMTIAWASPEQLNGDKIGPSSDIYSFGVCLWEIVTQKTPWEKCDMRTIIGNVIQGKTLRIEEGVCDEAVAAVIRSCWHRDPRARPTAQELVEALEALQ